MLKQLQIQNFILIDDLDVTFSDGLTVITGETGAGKSILIDALSVMLGARASKSYVRSGMDKAVLKGLFEVDGPFMAQLKALGYEIPADQGLLVEKEIHASGKSVSRINGAPLSAQELKTIGDLLVDIHGQHDHQSLFNGSTHGAVLEAFDAETAVSAEAVRQAVEAYRALEKRLQALNMDDEEVARQVELIQYQMDDIDKVQLKPADDDIEREFELIKASESLLTTLNGLEGLFKGDDEQAGLIHQLLHEHKELRRYETLSEPLKGLSARLNDLVYQAEDFTQELRAVSEDLSVDEEQLYHLEKRLDQVNLLKRKYGHTVSDILTFRAAAEAKYEELIQLNELRGTYQAKRAELYQVFCDKARELSLKRRAAAKAFEKEMAEELAALNLPQTTFVVEFTDLSDEEGVYPVSARGFEYVEFMVSFNPGELVRPLKQIASGGEMSRVMLALKVLFGRQDRIPTMIFDEVDSGISGKTASVVSEKLYQVASNHQVLCISHLSQLALMGDHHYLISKESDGIHTKTNLERLAGSAQDEELARLLGGAHYTKTTLEHVTELREQVNHIKKGIRKTHG